MSVSSIFREAAQALRFNRQRSLLTTISLAWGVACFVILYSYGDGFHTALQLAFRQVGQDLIVIFNGQTSTQAAYDFYKPDIDKILANPDAYLKPLKEAR